MKIAFTSGRPSLLPARVTSGPQHAARRHAHQGSGAVTVRASSWAETGEAGWLRPAAAALAAGMLLLSPLASTAAVDAGDVLVGPPRVVDGDTLVVAGERIRLFGLDAPESKQSCSGASGKPYACGEEAAEALRRKIGSASVQCSVRQRDMYGRAVSSCQLPGTGDIGDWLVSNGYAVAYRQYSKEYVGDEEAARAAHRGIWQGTFEMPAEWRKENKRGGGNGNGTAVEVAQASTPGPLAKPLATLGSSLGAAAAGQLQQPGCEIKGNVSSKGDRIYHVPGGRYYANVKIEPEKGEQFFCTERDAEAAGFRKSRE